MYLLASDPGTASPPKRNSPVVMVWDVTEKPYELVYFHWVSGNGSYIPWLNSMKYALEKYNPHLRGGLTPPVPRKPSTNWSSSARGYPSTR
jgi:hypothetical protein